MTTTQQSASIPFDGPRRPAPPTELIDQARYTSRQFHDLEVEKMWSRTWQLACLQSELPRPGDHTTYTVGPYSVIIARRHDGTLSAYHNVCPHRGRRIKNGPGNSETITCGYHGWQWGLDGGIKGLPERETFAPVADADCGLTPAQVDTYHDWVFVCFDQKAAPLADYLAPVIPLLEPYRYDRQYRWHNHTKILKGNWKTTLDAFQEGYHGRMTHPESVEFVVSADHNVMLLGDHAEMTFEFGRPDPIAVTDKPDWQSMLDAMEWSFAAFGEDTQLIEVLRTMTLPDDQTLGEMMIPMMQAGMAANNMDVSGLTPDQLVDDWQFFIFPNIIVNTHAFGYWLFRMLPNGSDPDTSILDMWYFHRVPDGAEIPPDTPNTFLGDGDSAGAVVDQDIRNIENQQLGFHHPYFKGMRLSSLETRISHFHSVLERYIRSDEGMTR